MADLDADDDDDASPLLQHGTSSGHPHIRSPKAAGQHSIANGACDRAAPATPVRRSRSPLEPFPPFDHTVGPPESPASAHTASNAPEKQSARDKGSAAHILKEGLLSALVRCHTLYELAKRVPHKKAQEHIGEAWRILEALEGDVVGAQLAERSGLRTRLSALDKGLQEREEGENAERMREWLQRL